MGRDDCPKENNYYPPNEDELFASLRHGSVFVEFRHSYSPRVLVQVRKLEKIGPRDYAFEGKTDKGSAIAGRVHFSSVSFFDDRAELKISKTKAEIA